MYCIIQFVIERILPTGRMSPEAQRDKDLTLAGDLYRTYKMPYYPPYTRYRGKTYRGYWNGVNFQVAERCKPVGTVLIMSGNGVPVPKEELQQARKKAGELLETERVEKWRKTLQPPPAYEYRWEEYIREGF